MVIEIKPRVTAAEFDAFIALPENADKIFELIGGEIVEVPSNAASSQYSMVVGGEIYIYLKEHKIAHLTGEGGGFQVSGERYAPDIAVTLKIKQAKLDTKGYNSFPPDLAVEVDFPSTYQSQEQLRIKIVNYLAAGTTVWLLRPETKTAEVYRPGQPVQLLNINDSLSGDDILPGFTLALKGVFGE
ncbi:MAG: Uma2 family endonuclease [Anaerolineae bacterium]|nr:Uma2 family endonuclease [Anaerolineae bacterium]